MDNSLVELVAANVAFVGTHFAMSHPLRAPLVGVFGEKLFPAIYSIVSFATLGWVYFAYKAAPAADLGGSGQAGWIATTVLLIPAMVLFAGSFAGNPALPAPGAAEKATTGSERRFSRHTAPADVELQSLGAIAHHSLLEPAFGHHGDRDGLSRAGRRASSGPQEARADGRCLGAMGK